MGNVNRLRNCTVLNLLLPCISLRALYSRIYCKRWPSPPAWHPSTTVQQGSGKLGSIWQKTRRPLPFPIYVLFNIYLCLTTVVYNVYTVQYLPLTFQLSTFILYIYCIPGQFVSKIKKIEKYTVCGKVSIPQKLLRNEK